MKKISLFLLFLSAPLGLEALPELFGTPQEWLSLEHMSQVMGFAVRTLGPKNVLRLQTLLSQKAIKSGHPGEIFKQLEYEHSLHCPTGGPIALYDEQGRRLASDAPTCDCDTEAAATLQAQQKVLQLQAFVNKRYPDVSQEAKKLQCVDCYADSVYHTDWLIEFFNDESNVARLDEFFAMDKQFSDLVIPLNQHEPVPHGGARNTAHLQHLLAQTRNQAQERTRTQGIGRRASDTSFRVAVAGAVLLGAEVLRRN